MTHTRSQRLSHPAASNQNLCYSAKSIEHSIPRQLHSWFQLEPQLEPPHVFEDWLASVVISVGLQRSERTALWCTHTYNRTLRKSCVADDVSMTSSGLILNCVLGGNRRSQERQVRPVENLGRTIVVATRRHSTSQALDVEVERVAALVRLRCALARITEGASTKIQERLGASRGSDRRRGMLTRSEETWCARGGLGLPASGRSGGGPGAPCGGPKRRRFGSGRGRRRSPQRRDRRDITARSRLRRAAFHGEGPKVCRGGAGGWRSGGGGGRGVGRCACLGRGARLWHRSGS